MKPKRTEQLHSCGKSQQSRGGYEWDQHSGCVWYLLAVTKNDLHLTVSFSIRSDIHSGVHSTYFPALAFQIPNGSRRATQQISPKILFWTNGHHVHVCVSDDTVNEDVGCCCCCPCQGGTTLEQPYRQRLLLLSSCWNDCCCYVSCMFHRLFDRYMLYGVCSVSVCGCLVCVFHHSIMLS
jgi:hypothetical protein